MSVEALRVMTYNVHFGTDILGRGRLALQAATIAASGADVVLLQEVANRPQLDALAQQTGLTHVAFSATRRSWSGEFGNAILSRWPLTDREHQTVPSAVEPRGVLAATINNAVRVLATHFGLPPGEPEAAARVLLTLVSQTQLPVVMGGDLNRPFARATCHRLLRQLLLDAAASRPQPTFPSPAPFFRLDYLYVRDLTVQHTQVLPTTASDHRPLVADLRLKW